MTEKLAKPEVNYRKATSSRRCGNCSMFRRGRSEMMVSEGTCTLVKGDIDPFDVCDRWEPK